MGALSYGQWTFDFEDRLLTHLQIVIVSKFRRGDSFPMSWVNAVAVGSGRSSVWLTPSVPVFFAFDGDEVPQVDRAWLARLTESASSTTGLVIRDENGLPLRIGDDVGTRFRGGGAVAGRR